jgi:hypothetical protein
MRTQDIAGSRTCEPASHSVRPAGSHPLCSMQDHQPRTAPATGQSMHQLISLLHVAVPVNWFPGERQTAALAGPTGTTREELLPMAAALKDMARPNSGVTLRTGLAIW